MASKKSTTKSPATNISGEPIRSTQQQSAGHGGKLHQTAGANETMLTTNQGLVISDNHTLSRRV